MKLYKIRSNKTGQFSNGGSWPSFTKNGKLWKRACDVSNHFSLLSPHGRQMYKDQDVEIIEYELVETCTNVTSYADWIAATDERKEQKKEAQRRRFEEYQREQRRQEFIKLQKEFG